MIQLYQKINTLRILEVFLKDPYEGFYVRELSRMTDCSPMTALRSCSILKSDGFIIDQKIKDRTLFKGNLEAPSFRFMKISYNLDRLDKYGLISYLNERFEDLHSLILYGSFAKGRDGPKSDIDIILIAPKNAPLDLKVFETKLGHPISLQIFTTRSWADQVRSNHPFYMDIITEGIVLLGRRPVIE
jgi:predicted nucleotidyltransferase